jgi:hypothetical protein
LTIVTPLNVQEEMLSPGHGSEEVDQPEGPDIRPYEMPANTDREWSRCVPGHRGVMEQGQRAGSAFVSDAEIAALEPDVHLDHVDIGVERANKGLFRVAVGVGDPRGARASAHPLGCRA